jgi:hypothetical protein
VACWCARSRQEPTDVLATATTDANGDYTMSVAGNTDINIIVVSQMLRDAGQPLPRWNFAPGTPDGDARSHAYTYTDGQLQLQCGTGHNIDIPSGFNSTGTVTGTRASAPFAILDTVYQAVQLVLSVAPTRIFPSWCSDWATTIPVAKPTSHGASSAADRVVGDPTEDTDEFDQHVIAHEFGTTSKPTTRAPTTSAARTVSATSSIFASRSAKALATRSAPSCSTIRCRSTPSSTMARASRAPSM